MIRKINNAKKTILVDLDGVLNTYTGNYIENYIPPIKDGAKEFLENLSEKYSVNIFTTRKPSIVLKWAKKNKINHLIKDITNTKKPSYIQIDDRCIKFEGNYNKLIEDIENFKVWYK